MYLCQQTKNMSEWIRKIDPKNVDKHMFEDECGNALAWIPCVICWLNKDVHFFQKSK